MMNAWFRYFLQRSIVQRRGRFIISSAAVMLAVTVVSALATVSTGIRSSMGAQLRQYGANMIVTQAGGFMSDGVAEGVRRASEHIRDSTVQLYGTAQAGAYPVEVIGAEIAKVTGLRLYGRLPGSAAEAMVGVNLGELLAVKQGSRLDLGSGTGPLSITALFEKGTDEDSSVIMPLETARIVLGISGASAVLLNADARSLGAVEAAVKERYPFLHVRTVRQVAMAEERLLARIQLLMLVVTAVVLLSSVIALGSTMGANVIERMEEIGLMKSLGATRGHIRQFFMSEAMLAGLAGGAVGCVTGIAAAEAVARTAFGAFIPVHLLIAPASIIFGVFIAVLSTYFPVRDAMKVVPAQILRGE